MNYIEMQYFVSFGISLVLYCFLLPIYIYIYIYILGLRAIAIKYIKANYFDFVFLIGNLLLFYFNFIIIAKYEIFIEGFGFKFYLDWLFINMIIVNMLFSIASIVFNKHMFLKELFDKAYLFELDFKNKGFQYYCVYISIFVIFYELSYFKNLYNSNYHDLYIYCLFAYLNLIPIIMIFLYVMEKNNSINANYSLLKDRLLKKSLLVIKTFMFSIVNIVAVFVLSLFLIPVVFYLIYYIHILFGITPDIMELEGP
jgi:hypothetical protein